jgi:hypothetical protein
MTDAMMKAKLAVLEHDILQAAQSDPVKQMGVITPVAPPRSSRITIAT